MENPMKMMTAEIRKRLPKLYSQEKVADPIVQVKYFCPWGAWTAYATEFDGKDIFFGYVVGLETEMGNFSLSEMQAIRGPGGLGIERDLYFKPTPLSVIKRQYGDSNPRQSKDVMTCSKREGIRQCIWWVSGCLHPNVPPEVKRACSETYGKLPRMDMDMNPRPPKEWWDKMFKQVKKTYAHATARHPRITDKERLSQITGRIWWNISPEKRAELIEYYDEKAKLGIKNPIPKLNKRERELFAQCQANCRICFAEGGCADAAKLKRYRESLRKNPYTKGGWYCYWRYGVLGTNLSATPEQRITWYLWGHSPYGREHILAHYRMDGRRWAAFDDTKGGQSIGSYKRAPQARRAIEKRFGVKESLLVGE